MLEMFLGRVVIFFTSFETQAFNETLHCKETYPIQVASMSTSLRL